MSEKRALFIDALKGQITNYFRQMANLNFKMHA